MIFRIALQLLQLWVSRDRDLSPWPDGPVAASLNLLHTSPTLLPSLPRSYDTVWVHHYYRLQTIRITATPNSV